MRGMSEPENDNRRSTLANQEWLPDMDLNHDKQIQSLLCYRYTIGQTCDVKVEAWLGQSSSARSGMAEWSQNPKPKKQTRDLNIPETPVSSLRISDCWPAIAESGAEPNALIQHASRIPANPQIR